MNNLNKTLIHIGLHKTATSAMQTYWKNQKHINLCWQELLPLIKGGRANIKNQEPLNYIFPKLEVENDKSLNIYTSEGLSTYVWGEAASQEDVRACRKLFLEEFKSNVSQSSTVLIVVRSPVMWVNSIYKQYVQEGGHLSFKNFFNQEKNFLKETLSIRSLYTLWASYFGDENVLLLPYEMLIENHERFSDVLSQVIGQDVLGVLPSSNESITDKELTVMRELSSLLESFQQHSDINSEAYKNLKKHLIYKLRVDFQKGSGLKKYINQQAIELETKEFSFPSDFYEHLNKNFFEFLENKPIFFEYINRYRAELCNQQDSQKRNFTMPLLKLSAEEALENRKHNEFGSWPNRQDGLNRTEPRAKPNFDVSFKLAPGDTVFTIGSCFARNIEQLLEEQGFDIPVRKLLKRKDLKLETQGLLNNYGVPSILQELEWAFDENRPFQPEKGFLETSHGKFVDLNLMASNVMAGIRPDSFEQVMTRREAIINTTREISTSNVVIITLGLAEIWFDNHTQQYLNVAPRNQFIKKYPGRFELRVLEYNETLEMLQKAMDIIYLNGQKGIQVLLTVSPVPLETTHRAQDVMVANTYSKSLLRTVAETIVIKNDFVHYFPSYESVMLSDRKVAWRDDMVHVSPEIVAMNVGRLVSAYTSTSNEKTLETVRDEYLKVKAQRSMVKWPFFEENRDFIVQIPELAYDYAKTAIALELFDEAYWVVDFLKSETFPFYNELATAEILLAERRFDAAIHAANILEAVNMNHKNSKAINSHVHRIKMFSYVNQKNIELAKSSAMLWANQASTKAQSLTPLITLARELKKIDEFSEAKTFFENAINAGLDEVRNQLDYAEILLHLNEKQAAENVLIGVEVSSISDIKRKASLLNW